MKIRWSPAAIYKLEKIEKSISQDLGSPMAADNVISLILNTVEQLIYFPESGHPLAAFNAAIPKKYRETRLVLCGHYLVLYDINRNSIDILEIYHQSQDYIAHLIGKK